MDLNHDTRVACGNCVPICPTGAIAIKAARNRAQIDSQTCVECFQGFRGVSQEHLNTTIVRPVPRVLSSAGLCAERLPEDDGQRLSELNWRFHEMLAEASGQQRPQNVVQTLRAAMQPYRAVTLASGEIHQRWALDHVTVAELRSRALRLAGEK